MTDQTPGPALRWALLTAPAYIACVVLANVLTEHYGLVPVGFGLTVTAGTFAAGATLLARNVTQDASGRLLVLALMLVGCGLSWWLASPQLAEASAVAFALSETADMAVYSPLRDRGWARAVACAALVGAVVDTLAFLWLAGFPVTPGTVSGQLLVKVGISWLVAAAGVPKPERTTKAMSDHYDRQGHPITASEWAAAYTDVNKRVALDEQDGVRVSTVWLGLNYQWGPGGPPLIFETMVFGGEHDQEEWRYSTEAEALAGHAEICSAVFRAVSR